ncbi:MAG: glycosyltransferase family 4 protein [Sphingobacterium sp.]|jgi:glycosyltransferase involved in cell wall biosynthesis|nr:glycosyltransferase family 4 protein [Sphingobacterium sp.]
MKFNFVLPFYTKVPSGGTKIMYEYANRLSLLGHEVRVYHCIDSPYFSYASNRPFLIRKLITLLIYRNKPSSPWFNFSPAVKLKFINRLANEYLQDADVTVVTWWSLVEPLRNLDATKGKKINLIQDYENWEGNVDLLHKSYTYKNIIKIGISPYVINAVKKIDSDIHYIPNAIDSKKYFADVDFNKRQHCSFCMLYSNEPRKGSQIGIEAFIALKARNENISLTLFGTSSRPDDLPEWIKYVSNLSDLKDLYNKHLFFVSNSLEEGWGLPIHEAMACGCVIVCTKILGHLQFYQSSEGVFTYEKGNSLSMVQAIESMLMLSMGQLKVYSGLNREAVASYEWNTVISQLLEIVKK